MSRIDKPLLDLQAKLEGLAPTFKIHVRERLFGGLSGASLFLVDFHNQTEQQLGVIKTSRAKSAAREIDGNISARKSWLVDFLPERFDQLGTIDGRVVLLSSLAKDRLEDCHTLEQILRNGFSYGRDHILNSLAYAYRTQARETWNTARETTLQECFCAPIVNELSDTWKTNWNEAGMPSIECSGVVFEDSDERWPNPAAFLLSNELWSEFGTRLSIPWIESHGDLNSRNVLSPSYQRAVSQNKVSKNPQPTNTLKHVSLIDMPFFRVAPFTYDPTFLLTTLNFLLPEFDSRINRENILKAYRHVVDLVTLQVSQATTHSSCSPFVDCCNVVLNQLKLAQERFPKDIELACLSCLASSSLWRAIKTIDRANRDERARTNAVQLFCQSAIALKALLKYSNDNCKIPGNDFKLWTRDADATSGKWSNDARRIAFELSNVSETGGIILCTGREFSQICDLPTDSECKLLKEKSTNEILTVLDVPLTSALKTKLGNMAQLPITAILDWSFFCQARKAVSSALVPPRTLKAVMPGNSKFDVSDRDAVSYFHWRGSFEEIDSGIGLTAPERNTIRVGFRDALARVAKKRSPNQSIVYVGVPSGDVREMHEDLQQVWKHKLNALFVGTVSSGDIEYFDDWGIATIPGTVVDFLEACGGFGSNSTQKAVAFESSSLALTVSGVERDANGDITTAHGKSTTIELEELDYAAVTQAGHLYLDRDLSGIGTGSRQPRDFFVGHRIQPSELLNDVPMERDLFVHFKELIREKLDDRRPNSVTVFSQPGAGASTLLQCLGIDAAKSNVPTLILSQGGSAAFDAIERLHHIVNRSMLVVADIEDVSTDELSGLITRCGPPRYPVVFLSSRRTLSGTDAEDPMLLNRLSPVEKASLVERLGRYCTGVPIGDLLRSQETSIFLLNLIAFGGENVNIDRYVAEVLQHASERQQTMIATIAFFSRYGHHSTSIEVLEAIESCTGSEIENDLEPFEEILILRDGNSWSCRHDLLSGKILQYRLTGKFDEQWRYGLADFAVSLFARVDGYAPGGDLVAEYVWSVLNPQLDSASLDSDFVPRLMYGRDDGIPEIIGRHRVYKVAAEKFPENVNLVSHFGKFLFQKEKKFSESEMYLVRALDLDEKNPAVLHMLGMKVFEELKDFMKNHPYRGRSEDDGKTIDALSKASHDWFDRARDADIASEYNYTAPMQLNIRLIRDEFAKAGIRHGAESPEVLATEKVATLISHSESLADQGLKFIPPLEEKRRYFSTVRDELKDLRGDLETAIGSFEKRITKFSGSHLSCARIQLARLLRERGESYWMAKNFKSANKDFEVAERHLGLVLEDPARRFENIRLWFDCARFVSHWTIEDLLDRLHALHNHRPSLDTSFLLACLYFCDAMDTGSSNSWRKHQEYQMDAVRRSSLLTVRSYAREWLVQMQIGTKSELRILPNHLFNKDEAGDEAKARIPLDESRSIFRGTISKVLSSTMAYLKVEPMGYEIFFKPRVGELRFYKQDEGNAHVEFTVAFTYDKPIAYIASRID
jgi:hypothetical protein